MATTQQPIGTTALRSPLQEVLAQVARRLWLALWIRLAARGTFVAVCLSLLCVGMAHWGLLPSWLPLEFTIPILLLFGVGIGTLFASFRPITPFSAAREVEVGLGLKERFSSALEFDQSRLTASDPEAVLLRRMQQEDAAIHARALRPADVVPLRLPWEAKALIPLFLLLLLALTLPALPFFMPPGEHAERAVVQKSGQELVRTARVVEKRADAQGLAATKQAAQNMQALGRQMAQGRMGKKQAMVQMARLSKQMADEQRRLAQAGDAVGQADKDMAQAGRQLAQSLQSPTTDKPVSLPAGKAGGKIGAMSGPHSSSQDGKTISDSTEMKKVAQALKQGDVSALSEQLRALAQRTAASPASPGGQQRTTQDLQKLSDALKGTSQSEVQKHVGAAADAMKRGDSPRAAAELRRAADAAESQAKQQQDTRGVADARQSLRDSQERMAQSVLPPANGHDASGHQGIADNPRATAPKGQSSQGQGPPANASPNPGQGPGSNQGNGSGHHGGSQPGGAPGSTGGGGTSQDAGRGETTPSVHTGALHGAPHPLDARFNPTQNPKYGRIYLGSGSGNGGGGKMLSTKPGVQVPTKVHPSDVPYYAALAPARRSAETAMDKEDIPPAYRSSVRQYFDALEPGVVKPAK